MKKILAIILISFLVFYSNLNAQDKKDDVLINIDDVEVTISEFERIYKKNNTDSVIDKESIEEYLDLFINFKLKVLEAERLGMDTLKTFEVELNGYRRQLEKPYLTNQDIDKALMEEAYERMKKDVKSSHILIRLEETASPEDTLKAYRKIMEIRDRIVNGEDFAQVAKETSEDKSAVNNGGNLGYFTVFQMVYPFETAAYTTPVGEISMPVRTKYGYHIIKVWDVRDAVGRVKVAHIMKTIQRGAKPEMINQAEDTINFIYEQLMNGADFNEMALKYSDDKSTASRGGELRMFGPGKMLPEFEDAAFALTKVGEISKPVKTSYGFHILKLLQKSEIGSYQEMENLIKTKITRDTRSEKSKSAVVEQLKKEYNFKYNHKSMTELYKIVDESALNGQWMGNDQIRLNKDFIWFADQVYHQGNFADYMIERNPPVKVTTVKDYVDIMFEYFVESIIFRYERAQLENKYPEFRYLMQEYHDGILLFELTDKKVWSKAVQDTAGLKEFYEANKENYYWGERFDGRIYFCKDEKTFKKVNKFLNKEENQKLAIDEILESFNKKDSVLSIEAGVYSKGDHEIIDHFAWNIGPYNEANSTVKAVVKGAKLEPMPKKLDEAKGLITADYQTFLEKQWIDELREKYNITVNEALLETLYE